MRVLRIDSERGLALCCGPAGGRSSVEIALVEPVAPGEVLLVHAGTALGRSAERDAGAQSLDAAEQDAEILDAAGRAAEVLDAAAQGAPA